MFANPHHRQHTSDSRHHLRTRNSNPKRPQSPRTGRARTQRTQKTNVKFQCSEIPLRILMPKDRIIPALVIQ
ncbi:hypothetical protein ACN42_g1225 [Penicillium freii]|uniref:Uncharacterized protein n=1 Tax=Penicillium freii TaxID=48697 RepID=A0A117NRN3_PENFR|nr:hypothetical protein ACN42_g1225 [Penicillium freii]